MAQEMDFDIQDLVDVEKNFYNSGYQDGYEHGRIHGMIEGRALGREKGYEMWEELGFYEGFALMWKVILESQNKEDDRAHNNIKHLLDLIAQFPRVNPSASESSELDIPKLFRQIRSRYKVLCATLGTRSSIRAAGTNAQGDVDDLGDSPSEMQAPQKSSVWRIDSVQQASQSDSLSF